MAKKLGVAFGGSGAEGMACIAYIKAMEEAGIKPDIVSGTGIGGVIAAMFAAGMQYQDMMDFAKEIEFPGSRRPINLNKLKDDKHGLLDDMGLEEYFKMAVPILVFDRLYFPLRISAAELSTGSEVVFTEGNVGRAVRAGVSVPGIFTPYEVGGVKYIDGSCVNPVPFDIISDECDILAGICPEMNEKNEAGYNVFTTILGAYNATKKSLSLEKQKACKIDFYENVAIENFGTFDFAYYEEIISSVQEKADSFVIDLKDALEE